MRCKSGDICMEEALEDKRFCEGHQLQLDEIRLELKESAKRKMGRKKKPWVATCTRTGCFEPRENGSDLCEICIEAGFEKIAA
jgi:hypothetical protein